MSLRSGPVPVGPVPVGPVPVGLVPVGPVPVGVLRPPSQVVLARARTHVASKRARENLERLCVRIQRVFVRDIPNSSQFVLKLFSRIYSRTSV